MNFMSSPSPNLSNPNLTASRDASPACCEIGILSRCEAELKSNSNQVLHRGWHPLPLARSHTGTSRQTGGVMVGQWPIYR